MSFKVGTLCINLLTTRKLAFVYPSFRVRRTVLMTSCVMPLDDRRCYRTRYNMLVLGTNRRWETVRRNWYQPIESIGTDKGLISLSPRFPFLVSFFSCQRDTHLATPCGLLAVTLTIALLPPAPWRFRWWWTSSIELPLEEWLEFEWPWPDSGLDGGVRICPSPSHPLSSSSSIS